MNGNTRVKATSLFNISHLSLKEWSPVVWLSLSAVICLALFFTSLSIGYASRKNLDSAVTVYCASAAVEPFSRIVEQFNSSDLAQSEGIVVEITRVGGSGALAGQLSAEVMTGLRNMADVLVSADSKRMSNLIEKNFVSETLPIATQNPVIAIRCPARSDMLQVRDLSTLLNQELKLGIGSTTSAIGAETHRIAKLSNCSDRLRAHKTADFENVMSLAQALSIGSVDAAIVWDSTVFQFNQTGNLPIKVLAYLQPVTKIPKALTSDVKPNDRVYEENASVVERFSKFSEDKATNLERPGCLIEVGRSISDNRQADLFFSFLKTNRGETLPAFVDAGFSSLPTESSLDNGQESNQQ